MANFEMKFTCLSSEASCIAAYNLEIYLGIMDVTYVTFYTKPNKMDISTSETAWCFVSDLCLVFAMLSRLFIAALWSPEWKGLTFWLLFMTFIMILLLFHLVS